MNDVTNRLKQLERWPYGCFNGEVKRFATCRTEEVGSPQPDLQRSGWQSPPNTPAAFRVFQAVVAPSFAGLAMVNDGGRSTIRLREADPEHFCRTGRDGGCRR